MSCKLNKTPTSQSTEKRPCADDSSIESTQPTNNRQPVTTHDKPSLHGKVLIAEDNDVNQKVISLMLKSCNLNFEIAEDGLKVIECLNRNHYDLILMDCQMPELDGYETTRIIRNSNKPYQGIPIIALTANAMASDRDKCIAAGMNGFIAKPVNQQHLNDTPKEWLNPNTDGVVNSDNNTPENSHNVLIDQTELLALINIMEDEFNTLLETFIQDSEIKLETLALTVHASNTLETNDILHLLKGSCLSIGAIRLISLLTSLETLANEASFNGIKQRLPQLERCYRETVDEINRIVTNHTIR